MAKKLEGEAREEYLRRLDRVLSRLFIVLALLVALIVLIVAVASRDLLAAGIVLAALFTGVFFLVGLVSWIRLGGHGIISNKRVFQFLLLISVVVALLYAIWNYFVNGGLIFIGTPVASGDVNPYHDLVNAALTFVAMGFALFVFQLTVVCEGFGIIWFAGLVIRRLMPGVLKGVRLATFTRKDGAQTRMMLWLMDIPDILDLSRLKVQAEKPKGKFPWDRFYHAIFWEIFLGTIIAIYVSLNPILLESLDIVQAFSVLSFISLVIPIIIIPWFALLALQARIPGVTKEFELFRGIRSRFLQTFVALGTIVVFIRLALEKQDLGVVMGSFASYYVLLGVFSVYFAFVYFNCFENDLARETERRYQKL
ncbi:MAG TPA: hypothetical protein VLU38_00730 [Methanomassiliicoccales archaeon]|nr:hypothetical protein [Methanomassiliicoccales archaeon]